MNNYILISIGFTIGNFFYCWITGKSMSIGAERSFLQVVTIFTCWLSTRTP